MNFAYNYINNIDRLRNLLVASCLDNFTEDTEVEVSTEDSISTYTDVESGKTLCKIEYTDNGAYFYEKKNS